MKNKLIETIKTYKWKSVFFKYLTSLIIIIIAVLIPYNIILYTYYNYFLTREIAAQESINTFKSKNIFDLLTSSFNTNYKVACDTKFVNDFVNALENNRNSESSKATCDFVKSITTSDDLVNDIFIYSFKNNNFISSSGITSVVDRNYYPWLTTYNGTKLPFLMFPRKINSDKYNYLFICREMYDEYNNVVGIFCSKINYEDFTNVIDKSFDEKPEKIFIVSNIGLILYSNEYAQINSLMFEKPDIYSAFNMAKSTEGNSFIYDKYVISVAKSINSNLILMSYSEQNSLIKNDDFLLKIVVIGTLAILIVSFSIAIFLSYKQYKSVLNVMDILNNPHKLNHDDNILSEFFYIANAISSNSVKTNQISNELSRKILLLKQAQIQALQTQINPHFLFNTLQLINLSIIKEMKKDTIATNLISELSDLLRTSCDTDNYMISVKEEIENTKKYLSIQQTRYKNRLHVFYNIDKNCEDCTTLKLLLQPFAENCIVHGFKGKEADWNIYINCFKRDDNIVFAITDDGVGIEKLRLEEVNNKIKENRFNTDSSIGISNVNQRLRLLYGSNYSINITSDTYTTIEIRHILDQR